MIKKIELYHNAVEVLPMLKIHKDNKMGYLGLDCYDKAELGNLFKREDRIFIGSVDEVELNDYSINLLTKIETKEGNEMETLMIHGCYISDIEPLLKNEEKIFLGKIKNWMLIIVIMMTRKKK
ncbi:MAG: uncharacterized protein A8A55_1898 [Amphiamblys sp. WSBS2006]|nr:MAG: uncharacterized protein A8A55_1898 [Amphiamblys sp. WSBS2006]